jgi:hypothetical protein
MSEKHIATAVVAVLATIFIAFIMAGLNADSTEWVEQDECFIRIHDSNSWGRSDTSVTTYCPK